MPAHTDVIRTLVERWNAGNVEGALELYTDDAVVVDGPDWPEQARREGHEALRSWMLDWLAVWDSAHIDLTSIETCADKVVATGSWVIRGRSSGIAGTMPFVILFGLRAGKIESHVWFTDHDAAVDAARGA